MKLRVMATPGASRNEVLGWEETPLAGVVLKVRITAPPVEGKANKALVHFLASILGISKSQITLTKGQQSRIKTFEIPNNLELPF